MSSTWSLKLSTTTVACTESVISEIGDVAVSIAYGHTDVLQDKEVIQAELTTLSPL